MAHRTKTADQILEAARRRFNQKGYASTTLAEIAASIEISQGNLTYHYRTKRDLVTRLQQQVAQRIQQHHARGVPDHLEDEYVERLRFVFELNATYRFLLRDDAQIEPGPEHQSPHQVLLDDFAALSALMARVEQAGWLRRDYSVDLGILTRSLWVLSRFWMDFLSEMELRQEPDWEDQRRGIEHHFAVLLPNLTATGRRRFEAALNRICEAQGRP